MPRIYKQTSVVGIERLEVDDEDDDLNKHNWRLSNNGYAIRGPNISKVQRKALYAHRVILERILGRTLTAGEYVDHINGCKLDNHRSNLRLANKSQNAMNSRPRIGCSSRYVGVYNPTPGKWAAYINVDSKRQQVGIFSTEDEAAWMRDQWAIELHGEYARMNLDYVRTPLKLSTPISNRIDNITAHLHNQRQEI